MSTLPHRIFVTGTDTDAGKTVISALLTLGLKAHYWKPVQSGCEIDSDTKTVQELTGLSDEHFLPESYRLTEPLSPHEAAVRDGVRIDLDTIQLPTSFTSLPAETPLVVEGAGGILVPLAPGVLTIDLVKKLELPALVVARSGLGTINHTLLTLHALRASDIPIAGVVLNGPRHPENAEAIEEYGQVPVLAQVEQLELSPHALAAAFANAFA
ncbi:dethiobiotin synthase [Desulfobaculum bizertense]|uniref:ATP-dependent dethiobiotin synthetase BioD n=1 Tax=Desulfobaculum bizertense DSM 18034 TaxID=1121442 RepID=A0A1T4W7R3_9BACT|nr:dethiobiotin synthase [Desulfobaculum bizertense]UIJ39161.1 dethiobiotin synthase [Desulfobaculum bizertense]SKA73332.1 dethiobiotin synthetase [Desulfobaculum bizertense DSM 18034]